MKKTFLLLFLFFPVFLQAQIITTVAGNGMGGYGGDGGPATSASVGNMVGVVFDRFGNYYFAENNNSVRKVSTTGVISTIAGTGIAGYNGDNILATAAQLNRPIFVTVDTIGNIYIADENNNRIRKISAATAIITTIAGTGVAGFNGDSILATTAQLNAPYGICMDANQNLYIGDHLNYRIRKINASGFISTIAGNGVGGYYGDNGPATNAQINGTSGICTDTAGNIYICDGARIRKVNALANIITTYAGNGTFGYVGDNGLATSAEIWYPDAVTSSSQNDIYVADGNRVRKVDNSGIIHTVAGGINSSYSGDDGPATLAGISSARGVAMDPCGNLYIADNGNGRIRKVSFNPNCWPENVSAPHTSNSITLYPNPTHNNLTITSTQKIINITITNLIGQTVYTHEYATQTANISTTDLSPGLYLIKINNTDVRKFIKE